MEPVIVDYGVGNPGSIRNMLKRIGVRSHLSRDPAVIRGADGLILPGVGAFDTAVHKIRELGLWDAIDAVASSGKTPILGICLGMQLLTEGSAEGRERGFGWIPGRCARFDASTHPGLKVPHMGWSPVRVERATPLTAGFDGDTRFYFVHSFHVCPADAADVILVTEHGDRFVSGVHRGNVFGVQFHPEKSHRHGMNVLRNFAALRA